VLDRYGAPAGVGGNMHPMPLDELLDYLQKIDNFSLSPWVALVGQTEAIGDPATPSREQIAVLRWLGKALELWEKQSPLEGSVAAQVRRLKPLSAALALTDPDFLQPGAHPLHQLLDGIQVRAIGWQARLDRVGAILEQQVTKAVEQSRRWFDSPSIDLVAICAEFSAAAQRDQARAQRMVQRVVDAEAGKIKSAAAKQEAAKMINAALEKYLTPDEIGGFIKGPWYTSAQLLLLKFGAGSEQWEKMSATTETLLDSFQNMAEADEARRQHIFEVVTQLPKEMRRWLLSLHHDTEAVNEAMGLVEFAHLRILRRQPLALQQIPPIIVEGDHVISDESRSSAGAMKNWPEGQWFSVETSNDGTVRMQLALKVEPSQQLLFTNLAGIKVLQLSYTEFNRLITQDKVKALHSGANFSLCLAHAAGIDSVEILNALASAMEETQIATAARAAQNTPRAAPHSTPEVSAETGSDGAYTVEELEHAPDPQSEPETDPNTESGAEEDLAWLKKIDSKPGSLIEQAEEIKALGGYLSARIKISEDHYDSSANKPTETRADSGTEQDHSQEQSSPADSPTSADDDMTKEFLAGQPGTLDPQQDDLPDALDGETDIELYTADEPVERTVDLPMGAWLGFHDGDTPLMARLAVYDLENDYYIFVNRQGVKMRQVNRLALLKLIDDGLVDILETKSNFRDEVTEVRKNLDPR
jgi:hypothetical protein